MYTSSSLAHLLLVEDDSTLAQSVFLGLREAGFEVTLCNDGTRASEVMQRQHFDLVLLDLMLPGKTGEELLLEWRDRYTTPVIVFSARTELSDRVRCFDLGAVDYLPKPFWVKELLVRIRTRLRLREEEPSQEFQWADVVVALEAREVSRGGVLLSLTPSEFNILRYLLERQGRAVSRDQIAEHTLTVSGEPVSPRTVDGHVARLRQKLGEDAGAALQTVWGVGYRFRAEKSLEH